MDVDDLVVRKEMMSSYALIDETDSLSMIGCTGGGTPLFEDT
jgi:hypothetical protein